MHDLKFDKEIHSNFNDEIIDQTAPLIYGVGSWSIQSI